MGNVRVYKGKIPINPKCIPTFGIGRDSYGVWRV
jgi:hypothetical protein